MCKQFTLLAIMNFKFDGKLEALMNGLYQQSGAPDPKDPPHPRPRAPRSLCRGQHCSSHPPPQSADHDLCCTTKMLLFDIIEKVGLHSLHVTRGLPPLEGCWLSFD